ncbi:Dps family protein [Candidatus Babela massiliensis]|uniref:DNA-binding ferritin-like protein n=1 Tax=Candidatus Babela massiliensis TaxID=673862 RepID=V6DK60_9BACT|nr:Dps family protein [Candidatus Babela massiliensis]CDK30916.1 DNA-binding ferritin-like protein [Candidatus Babela massiliensis]
MDEMRLNKDNINLDIDISQENRKAVAKLLTQLLADEYTLGLKTKKYHWNLWGLHFYTLHRFFDKHYDKIQEYVDLIAERIRALGFSSIGTLREFLDNTSIEENPGIIPNDIEMIKHLWQDHEAIIKRIRFLISQSSKLRDEGTANMLADLIVKHESMAWMLRSFLEQKS